MYLRLLTEKYCVDFSEKEFLIRTFSQLVVFSRENFLLKTLFLTDIFHNRAFQDSDISFRQKVTAPTKFKSEEKEKKNSCCEFVLSIDPSIEKGTKNKTENSSRSINL